MLYEKNYYTLQKQYLEAKARYYYLTDNGFIDCDDEFDELWDLWSIVAHLRHLAFKAKTF